MSGNPWLRIPAGEYEAHMGEIGQAAALRESFRRVYDEVKPRRVLILGCTTARDVDLVDPGVTETCVGVDLNDEFLGAARERLAGQTVQLVCGDVLEVELPGRFDLVHAALLLEYVDPAALFQRIAEWLGPDGVCSTVTQNPGAAAVSRTAYHSLLALDGHLFLHTPAQVRAFALRAGLARIDTVELALPHGKSFSASTFGRGKSFPLARASS